MFGERKHKKGKRGWFLCVCVSERETTGHAGWNRINRSDEMKSNSIKLYAIANSQQQQMNTHEHAQDSAKTLRHQQQQRHFPDRMCSSAASNIAKDLNQPAF